MIHRSAVRTTNTNWFVFVGDYRVQTEHRLKAGGQLPGSMRNGFLTGRFRSVSEGYDADLELAQKITRD